MLPQLSSWGPENRRAAKQNGKKKALKLRIIPNPFWGILLPLREDHCGNVHTKAVYHIVKQHQVIDYGWDVEKMTWMRVNPKYNL